MEHEVYYLYFNDQNGEPVYLSWVNFVDGFIERWDLTKDPGLAHSFPTEVEAHTRVEEMMSVEHATAEDDTSYTAKRWKMASAKLTVTHH